MAALYTFLFIAGSALLTGGGLFLLARAGWRKLSIVLIALLALALLLTIRQARGAEGMAGLAIMIWAVLLFLPATLGGIIGALIGDWQWRRRRRFGPDGTGPDGKGQDGDEAGPG